MTWIKLTNSQTDDAWSEFYDKYKFRPSVDPREFPGIEEPVPSVTYSYSRNQKADEESSFLFEQDLTRRVLVAFREIVAPGDSLLALDWQHQCYSVDPHAIEPSELAANWLIPVLPDGDYSIFLTKHFDVGIFGHPWEETICVFGQPLIAALELLHPLSFTDVIRKNGKKVSQSEPQSDPKGTMLKVFISYPSGTTDSFISNILGDLKRAFYEKNRLTAFYITSWVESGYWLYVGDPENCDDVTISTAMNVLNGYILPPGSYINRPDANLASS